VVVLIDREQGAGELLAARGYALHALLTISECFTLGEREGLADPERVAESRRFLQTARFA
jgi:orotate phosphoribosyltransferase